MADKGQHEVFNFDTPGSEFECAIERKEYLPGESTLSSMTFTRKRQGKPDDTVFLWLKTEWLDVIVDAIKTATPGALTEREIAVSSDAFDVPIKCPECEVEQEGSMFLGLAHHSVITCRACEHVAPVGEFRKDTPGYGGKK